MKIKFLKPHTHAGREYQPSDAVIELDDMTKDQAEWLKSLKVVEIVEDAPAASAKPAK